MREIKFRAWGKERKVMSIVRAWDFAHGNVEMGKELSPEADKFEHELEIMQFTGLKDKNGKEIYEGDIVRVKDSHSGYGFENGVVNFRTETNPDYAWGWRIDWIGKRKIPQNLTVILGAEKVEVIGNIYENPELLNNSNHENNT